MAQNILDYLNEDCWWILLSYLGIEDLIRSERVSRHWQRLVLTYLGGVRICIEGTKNNDSKQKDQYKYNCRYTLKQAYGPSFESWARKLGTQIVAVYCTDRRSWKIYRQNCPNLESITVPEVTVAQFLNNTALEDLEIEINDTITGKCFNNIQSKLKSLNLYRCKSLMLRHLKSAADSFSELTRLQLVGVDGKVYEDIPGMLLIMTKLELLVLHTDHTEDVMSCDAFIEALCQLTSLKELKVNCRATDDHLEAVTRCCKELRSLYLGPCVDCEVTGRGVKAICSNAGERLTTLAILTSDDITDDDVVTCVRSCPNLKFLNVRGCHMLTKNALTGVRDVLYAEHARGRQLTFVSEILPSRQNERPSIRSFSRQSLLEYVRDVEKRFPYLHYHFGDEIGDN